VPPSKASLTTGGTRATVWEPPLYAIGLWWTAWRKASCTTKYLRNTLSLQYEVSPMQIHFSKQMSRETLPADLTNIEF